MLITAAVLMMVWSGDPVPDAQPTPPTLPFRNGVVQISVTRGAGLAERMAR